MDVAIFGQGQRDGSVILVYIPRTSACHLRADDSIDLNFEDTNVCYWDEVLVDFSNRCMFVEFDWIAGSMNPFVFVRSKHGSILVSPPAVHFM